MSEKKIDPCLPDGHVATTEGITELRRQEALLLKIALCSAPAFSNAS